MTRVLLCLQGTIRRTISAAAAGVTRPQQRRRCLTSFVAQRPTVVDAWSSSSSSSSQRTVSSSSSGYEWRQRQLEKLKRKFDETSPSQTVEREDDLQQMWREMEGRVTRRRPRTVEEMGGKTGRTNIKSTEEEYWLQEGLYDDKEDEDGGSANDDSKNE